MTVLVVVAIVLLVGATVWWSIRTTRAAQAATTQGLVQSGFAPCAEDAPRIEEIVRSVRQSREFEVRKPWKRMLRGAPVYWYEVVSNAGSEEHRVAADEFLCPLRRGSRQPFVLYLKPTNGAGSRILEKLIGVLEHSDLQALERPQNGQEDVFLAAFGPRGAKLHEMFDARDLSLFARGGQHGIFVIRGQGDHCTLELLGGPARKALGSTDWLDTWSFVQQASA